MTDDARHVPLNDVRREWGIITATIRMGKSTVFTSHGRPFARIRGVSGTVSGGIQRVRLADVRLEWGAITSRIKLGEPTVLTRRGADFAIIEPLASARRDAA